MKIRGLNYNFEPIRTIGDGSCLIHAILQGFSMKYNNLNSDNEKSKLVRETRFHLSEILEVPLKNYNNKKIYQILSRGELEEISKELPEASIEYMKKYLNSSNFLTLQYVELLSEIFDINIIFISEKEKDIYYSGDNELLFKDKRDTVFINYIDEAHYETLKINHKTLFNYDDNLVVDVKNKIKNRILV